MKKVFISVIVLFLLFSIMGLTACGNKNKVKSIKFDTNEIICGLHKSQTINFSIESYNNKTVANIEPIFECSDADIVSFNSSKIFSSLTITGKAIGECEITAKIGNITDTIKVKILLDPEITIAQTKDKKINQFEVKSCLPFGTKLDISLYNENYISTKTVSLGQSSYSKYSQTSIEFNSEEALSGTYTIVVSLHNLDNQPAEVKLILGENAKNLYGTYIVNNNGTKNFEVKAEFILPYKTDFEILCDTPYEKLTRDQMLTIIHWIEDRYDYYDRLYGRYTGDKYTKTIFNEAGSHFNKTYTDIDEIWMKSYELKYGK